MSSQIKFVCSNGLCFNPVNVQGGQCSKKCILAQQAATKEAELHNRARKVPLPYGCGGTYPEDDNSSSAGDRGKHYYG